MYTRVVSRCSDCVAKRKDGVFTFCRVSTTNMGDLEHDNSRTMNTVGRGRV